MNKKGFTLIELLAVLVVLAILALISVPITIRIINNARENSYKRSIANYGNVFREVIAMDNMENASNDYKPLSSYVAKVEKMYTGNRVQCNLAKSKLENGKLQLVECIIVKEVQENYDNSKNIAQYDYIYNNGLVSKKEYDYHIGDTFTLNGDSYHIIADSLNIDDYVVALKDNPLTSSEITSAGGTVGYIWNISDGNESGGMKYGSNSTYATSSVKSVVDSWSTSKFIDQLKTVDGYSARLITYDELQPEKEEIYITAGNYIKFIPKYDWMYNSNYSYWTMSQYGLYYMDRVWGVYEGVGYLEWISVNRYYGAVRPVINVYKSKLPS